jgi:ribosomal-protein-alanine N-acetyltransferase
MGGKTALQLRRLGPEHLGELAKIERENFPDPWSPDNILSELERPFCLPLGAFLGESLAGYSFAWILEGECHLLNLSVRKPLQGRGLGGLLLRTVIAAARAKACERVFLEVAEDNFRAKRLYGKFGFARTGRRKGYYARGADAILMTLFLEPAES